MWLKKGLCADIVKIPISSITCQFLTKYAAVMWHMQSNNLHIHGSAVPLPWQKLLRKFRHIKIPHEVALNHICLKTLNCNNGIVAVVFVIRDLKHQERWMARTFGNELQALGGVRHNVHHVITTNCVKLMLRTSVDRKM